MPERKDGWCGQHALTAQEYNKISFYKWKMQRDFVTDNALKRRIVTFYGWETLGSHSKLYLPHKNNLQLLDDLFCSA